jgi:hypothetical protein
LAIDPAPHVLRWREWAKARQLKTHNEAQKFGIKNVLNAAEVAEAEGSQPPIPLPQIAEQIDRYWSEHSTAFRSLEATAEGFPSILTFSGFYTAVYRKASNLIHADIASPDRFASMPLQGHVTIHKTEQHTESNDYPAFSGALFGFLLIVFGDRFGWPDRDVTEAIMDGLRYRPN